MSWNYRFIRTKDTSGTYIYNCHEVYYDDKTGEILSWSENPIVPQGETAAELVQDLINMGNGFQGAILEEIKDGDKHKLVEVHTSKFRNKK